MTTVRDDRILRETRVLAVFIVPFLLVAFPLLYLFPNDTGNWWAWEIRPSMTALIMGAGYIAGAYFFVRVALATRWHRVHLGFLPITAFTTFLGGRDVHLLGSLRPRPRRLLALDGAVRDDAVPRAARVAAQPVDGSRHAGAADDCYLPRRVRSILKVTGLLQFAIAVVLLASPSTMVDIWPWALTSLGGGHARGMVRAPGRHGVHDGRRRSLERDTHHAREPAHRARTDAARHARAWEQFDKSNAMTYVFVGGIALLLVGLARSGARWSSGGPRQPLAAPSALINQR